MKKYAAMLAAGLIAMLGLTALAPSAQASSTYPPSTIPTITLHLNLKKVPSHGTFTAVAQVNQNCAKLVLFFNGSKAKTGAGSSLTAVITAPSVTQTTNYPVQAACTIPGNSGKAGHAIAPSAQVYYSNTQYVTVVPSNGTGSGLPDTGGPSLGWLIGGIAALLAGGLAMFMGRRRSAGAASN